ncbi:MAG: hypothetical protein BAJALOKI2v1_170037 [Promethearchaeota archaeon]|nr:MAG: hypothetical protein BAJALOKI2v1_170037 [Candidatus Lokiarchaeota archaeon]
MLENLENEIKQYLETQFDSKTKIIHIGPLLEQDEKEDELKEFGYGKNILIKVRMNDKVRSYIMATLKENMFGHQHYYDRAKSLLFAYSSYNELPKHVKALDLGFYSKKDNIKSIGDVKEFFLLREKVAGTEYAEDLEKIMDLDRLQELDLKRSKALAHYLAKIHSNKKFDDKKHLYERKIRELVGSAECIMGLTDSYPIDLSYAPQESLERIEKKCIQWRYKLKSKKERLSQVHGDIHPWNILFDEGTDFNLLDRSRGKWGEPADDVVALSINYLFFSLLKEERINGAFFELFKIFWEEYLKESEDNEILEIAPPFFVYRSLVLASPIWYPDLDLNIRKKLFIFIENILSVDKFELKNTPEYFKIKNE